MRKDKSSKKSCSELCNDFRQIRSDFAWTDIWRYYHNEIGNIIVKNPKIDIKNGFYSFSNQCYFVTMAMAARRQLKVDKRAVSLKKFLKDLYNNYEQSDVSAKISQVIKKEEIDNDLRELERTLKKLEAITDQYLCHLDKSVYGKKQVISFDELNTYINTIGSYLNKYICITDSQGYLGHNIPDAATWKDIFKVPWIEDK